MICNLKRYQNPQFHQEKKHTAKCYQSQSFRGLNWPISHPNFVKSNAKLSLGVFVGLLWIVTGFYDSIISQAQLHKQSAARKQE